jgi:hypothetical protein
MRRDALSRALSSLCTVVTVLGSGRVHTWCDVVVTRGSGSDVDRRRDRRVVSCARGPVNGPCHSVGPVVRGTPVDERLTRSMRSMTSCVCRAGAGRVGDHGAGRSVLSRSSVRPQVTRDGAASQSGRPLANPQPRRPRAVPHRDARAGAGPRAPDGVAVRPARGPHGCELPVPRTGMRETRRKSDCRVFIYIITVLKYLIIEQVFYCECIGYVTTLVWRLAGRGGGRYWVRAARLPGWMPSGPAPPKAQAPR